jgi:hypothetical protein
MPDGSRYRIPDPWWKWDAGKALNWLIEQHPGASDDELSTQ